MATTNGGNINFNINMSVNKNGLNQILTPLQQIQTKLNSMSADKVQEEFRQAAGAAKQLESIINSSWNDKLNQLNLDKFNQGIKTAYGGVEGLKKSLEGAKGQGQAAFNAIASEVLNTNLQLKESNTLLDEMATTMGNTVKWGITSSIFNNITGSIQKAFYYAKDLDTSLNSIRIVTKDSADQMDRFAKIANNAAKDLGRSTLDYTKAALTFYQQGLNDDQVQARTEVTLKAQNITGAGSEMADYLTAVWNGFGVSAEQAEEYVDKLAKVADSSASDMSELAIAMSKVASTANVMGVDVDQLTAQLATVIATTRQAPESVGTAFKTIYSRLNDIQAGAEDAEISLGNYSGKMAELGFNVLDANGRLRDTGQVIEQIGSRWTTLSKEQQISLAQIMGGMRQVNQITALFENWTTYSELLNDSLSAQGSLNEKNDIYLQSTAAHMEQFRAEVEKTYDILFDQNTVNGFADVFKNALGLFNNFIEGVGGGVNVFTYFGSMVAGIFNKQISESILQTKRNFELTFSKKAVEKMKNDFAAQITADRVGNRQYDTMQQEAIAKAAEKQASIYQEIYKVRKGLNDEQVKELTTIQQQIGANTAKIESIRNYKTLLDQAGYSQSLTIPQIEGAVTAQKQQNAALTTCISYLERLSIENEGLTQEESKHLMNWQQVKVNIEGTTEEAKKFVQKYSEVPTEQQEIDNFQQEINSLLQQQKQKLQNGKTKLQEINEALKAKIDYENKVDKALEKENESLEKGKNLRLEQAQTKIQIQDIVKGFSSAGQILSSWAGAARVFNDELATSEQKANALVSSIQGTISGVGTMFGPIGMGVATLVNGAISFVKEITPLGDILENLFKTSQERIEQLNQSMAKIGQIERTDIVKISGLEEIQEEWEKLYKKYNENRKSMTEDQIARYHELSDKFSEYNKSVISGYDEQGNAIIANQNALKDTIQLLKEQKQAELQAAYASSGGTGQNKLAVADEKLLGNVGNEQELNKKLEIARANKESAITQYFESLGYSFTQMYSDLSEIYLRAQGDSDLLFDQEFFINLFGDDEDFKSSYRKYSQEIFDQIPLTVSDFLLQLNKALESGNIKDVEQFNFLSSFIDTLAETHTFAMDQYKNFFDNNEDIIIKTAEQYNEELDKAQALIKEAENRAADIKAGAIKFNQSILRQSYKYDVNENEVYKNLLGLDLDENLINTILNDFFQGWTLTLDKNQVSLKDKKAMSHRQVLDYALEYGEDLYSALQESQGIIQQAFASLDSEKVAKMSQEEYSEYVNGIVENVLDNLKDLNLTEKSKSTLQRFITAIFDLSEVNIDTGQIKTKSQSLAQEGTSALLEGLTQALQSRQMPQISTVSSYIMPSASKENLENIIKAYSLPPVEEIEKALDFENWLKDFDDSEKSKINQIIETLNWDNLISIAEKKGIDTGVGFAELVKKYVIGQLDELNAQEQIERIKTYIDSITNAITTLQSGKSLTQEEKSTLVEQLNISDEQLKQLEKNKDWLKFLIDEVLKIEEGAAERAAGIKALFPDISSLFQAKGNGTISLDEYNALFDEVFENQLTNLGLSTQAFEEYARVKGIALNDNDSRARALLLFEQSKNLTAVGDAATKAKDQIKQYGEGKATLQESFSAIQSVREAWQDLTGTPVNTDFIVQNIDAIVAAAQAGVTSLEELQDFIQKYQAKNQETQLGDDYKAEATKLSSIQGIGQSLSSGDTLNQDQLAVLREIVSQNEKLQQLYNEGNIYSQAFRDLLIEEEQKQREIVEATRELTLEQVKAQELALENALAEEKRKENLEDVITEEQHQIALASLKVASDEEQIKAANQIIEKYEQQSDRKETIQEIEEKLLELMGLRNQMEADQNKQLDVQSQKIQDIVNSYSKISETLSSGGTLSSEEMEDFSKILDQIVVKNYPELTSAAELLKETWLAGTDAYQEALEQVGQALEQISYDQLNQKLADEFKDIGQLTINIDDTELQNWISEVEDFLQADKDINIAVQTDAQQEFDDIISQLDEIYEAAGKIGQNFIVAAEDIGQLNTVFPGILDGMQMLDDGSYQLNANMVERAIGTAQATTQADVESVKAQLKSQADLLYKKSANYKTMADAARVLSQSQQKDSAESVSARITLSNGLTEVLKANSELHASNEKSAFEDIAKSSDQAGRAIGTNAASGAQSAYNSISDFVLNSINELVKLSDAVFYASSGQIIPSFTVGGANVRGSSYSGTTGNFNSSPTFKLPSFVGNIAQGAKNLFGNLFQGNSSSSSSSSNDPFNLSGEGDILKSVQQWVNGRTDLSSQQWNEVAKKLESLGQLTQQQANSLMNMYYQLDGKTVNIGKGIEQVKRGNGINGSKNKSSSSSSNKGSNKGGSGGSSKNGSGTTSKDDEEGQKIATLEEQHDAYADINSQLELLGNNLSTIKAEEKDLTGPELNANLQKQLEILEKQKKAYQEKLGLLKNEKEELKSSLSEYGAKFDSSTGLITNSEAILAKAQAELNKEINYYSSLSKKQQKAEKDKYDAAQKRYKEVQEWVKRYQQIVSKEIPGINKNIQDISSDQNKINKKLNPTDEDKKSKSSSKGTEKLIEEQADAYHVINTQLEVLSNNLSQLADKGKDLTGPELKQNLQQQLKILEKQEQAYKRKLSMLQMQGDTLKSTLASAGAQFDESTGAISNYEKVFADAQAELNKEINYYNSLSEEQREGEKQRLQAAKKRYEEIKDQLKRYDDIISKEIPGINGSILDIVDSQNTINKRLTVPKQQLEPLKEEVDIYHDINEEIERINNSLDILKDKQKDLSGKELLQSLNEQLELLQKQNAAYRNKLQLKQIEANDLKGKLAEQGVTFDSETGGISNYQSISRAKQAQFNKVRQYYSSLPEVEQQAYKKTYQKAEKDYQDFKDLVKRYEDLNSDDIVNIEGQIRQNESQQKRIQELTRPGGGEALEPLEEEKDRYHDINVELDNLSKSLSKVQKKESKLVGKEILSNLKQQNALLEKQISAYETKVQLAEQQSKQLQKSLKDQGVIFDQSGNIANYKQALEAQEAALNAQIEYYNGLSAVEKEEYKEKIDKLKEDYQKFKDNIAHYEELVGTEIPGLREDINDLIDQEIENSIRSFKVNIDLQIDVSQAQRDFNDFKVKVIDQIRQDDIVGNIRAAFENIYTYYKKGESNVIDGLTDQINNTLDQINQINKTGYSDVYGDNKAQAVEDLKAYADELMKDLSDVEDLVNTIKNSIFEAIDAAQAAFDRQKANYDFISELINHDVKVIQLLYGEDAYDSMQKYYNLQQQNNNKQLDFLKRQKEFWYARMVEQQSQMVNLDPNTNAWKEADAKFKKYRQNWEKSVSELNAKVESSLEDLIAKYSNAINKVFDEMQKKLTSGRGLEAVGEEWQHINDLADMYLDKVNSMYEIDKLENAFKDAIKNNEDNVNAQRSLTQLMNEQLAYLKDKDKLTKYDVDRANALFQIELKRLALENSRQSKSKLRLRRDSQGNYTYQYTADQEQITQAQQELNDAQNSLYNMTKQAYKSNLDSYYSTVSDWQDKVKNVYLDTTLTAEEQQQKIEQLNAFYGEKINILTDQNETLRQGLMRDTFIALADMYDVNVENFSNMSDKEKDILMGSMVPQWDSSIQEMINKVSGQGGLIPTTQGSFQELDNATKDYEESLDTLQGSAGENFKNIKEGIDQVIREENEQLLPSNEAVIDAQNRELDVVSKLVTEVGNLAKAYENAKKQAIEAATAAYNQWTTQQQIEKERQEAVRKKKEEEERQAAAEKEKAAQEKKKQQEEQKKKVEQQKKKQAEEKKKQEQKKKKQVEEKKKQEQKKKKQAEEKKQPQKKEVKDTEDHLPKPTIIKDEPKFQPIQPVKTDNKKVANKVGNLLGGAVTETGKNTSKTTKKSNTKSSKDLIDTVKKNSKANSKAIAANEEAYILEEQRRNQALADQATAQALAKEEKKKKKSSSASWSRIVEVYNLINSGSVGNDPQRKGNLANRGYNSTEISKGQELINRVYPSYLGGQGQNWDAAKKAMGYRTGGYTGNWGKEGKIGILHEKELILNKEDTKNILEAVNVTRSINNLLDRFINGASFSNILNSLPLLNKTNNNSLDQNVKIEANFPNVKNHLQIEKAFENLVNKASQYAFNTRK